MHDQEDGVRSWAVGALGHIGDPEDFDLIVSLLGDDSMRVRGAAALALGDMADSRGIEPLCAARRRLRRSPLEWYLHHKAYNKAIRKLKDGAKR